jgi:UDP:flavonoid glycosyltransferase YjiC (YdhE family)
VRKKEIVLLLPSAGAALGDVLPLARLGAVLADHGHSVTLVLAEKTRAALQASVGVDERFRIEVFPETSDPRFEWVRRLPVPSRRLLAFALVHVVPESFAKRDRLEDVVRRLAHVDVVVGNCVGIEELSRSHGFAQVAVSPSPYSAAVWRQRAYRIVWSFCARLTNRFVITPSLERRGVPAQPLPTGSRLLGLWSPLFLDSGSAGRVRWDAVGFPPARETALPEPVEAFLASGPAPVVFSLGSYTGSVGVDRVIRLASEVVDRLGGRAVVTTLGSDAAPAAAALPESVLVTSFVNLDALLPRGRALVHHGGIGTTASALRAGVPSVVAPMAFDQPFNARRCADLGAGVVLEPLTRIDGGVLADAIEKVSGSEYRDRVEGIARTVRAEDGFEAAAVRIEDLTAEPTTAVADRLGL